MTRISTPILSALKRLVRLAAFCAALSIVALPANAASYTLTRLTSDQAGVAANQDTDLVNPWGVSFAPGGPFWVSDNGTSKSTLYNGSGVKQGLVVAIPGAGGQASAPTGQAYNGNSSAFNVTSGGSTGSSAFIFVGEDGGITGWAPAVSFSNAIIAVDHSWRRAVYKGCDIVPTASGPVLLVCDFRNAVLEEFDQNFKLIGTFHAPTADGYAPFNVRALGGVIYVAYALQDSAKHDEVDGPGNGFVYTLNLATGVFTRLITKSHLNSPWGLALAPSNFGTFSNDLLVGNFGSGRIDAYNPATGHWLGSLSYGGGDPIYIPGLWDITFGGGGSGGQSNQLYFTAGTHHESHGLFGFVASAP